MFSWQVSWRNLPALDLTALTAVIALAAIGCCGLLCDISILLSHIHDDMPGPVRDQRLAHEALVAKVKAEMEADGKQVIAERKRNELENRKARRALPRDVVSCRHRRRRF